QVSVQVRDGRRHGGGGRVKPATTNRRGFTLVELLVTMTIMMILMGITLAAVNVTVSGDRVRSNARNIQSYLMGARDRAIFAKAPRGVRFLLDTDSSGNFTIPPTARSMVYIGPLDPSPGELHLADDGVTLTQESGAPWSTLFNRRLLVAGARIRIAISPGVDQINNGLWYTVASVAGNTITIATPHVENAAWDQSGLEYQLELAPGVLPNQEPIPLTSGIVIDPVGSRLPAAWSDLNRMDIMFSPRGTVTGQVAAAGVIHLLVTDWVDVSSDPYRGIGDPAKEGDESLVTIFTRTGQVSSHSVAPGADPYRYAETGEAAP
ncbi:MAG: prepilin-type N-terminal cleavage/methylation domain-containing protein, partial [Planctomycetaceae bacterium]